MKRQGAILEQQKCNLMKQAIQRLHSDGWTQLPILSTTESNLYSNELWDYLISLGTGIRKDDPNTWDNTAWPLNVNGTIQDGRVAHMRALWELRANEGVMKVYAKLLNCKETDLVVSFQGFNILRPQSKLRGQARYKKQSPGQFDQKVASKIPHYYEGFLSLSTTNAGFRFYDKSHLLHETFLKSGCIVKRDFYRLTDSDSKWYTEQPGCSIVEVPCLAGQLTIWDSRTVYADLNPKEGEPPRIGLHVCYVPRHYLIGSAKKNTTPLSYTKMRTDRQIAKRIKVFEEKTRATTFAPIPLKLYPTSNVDVPAELYSSYFGEPDVMTEKELTPVMRRLIGYDE